MNAISSPKLIVAISSRALFEQEAAHDVYQQEGVEAFRAYQRAREQEPLPPGPAFPLVKKFLALNQGAPTPLVEVLLLSRNAFDTGLRIFNSIAHYQLAITRAAFAGGESPYEYAKAFGAHLFLSLNPESVQGALASGCAAATIWCNHSPPLQSNNSTDQLRIAFDGDAVLFSDEAERVFQGEGLEKFHTVEWSAKDKPLPPGPFKGFLEALHQLQAIQPGQIRTALVTARSAPAHERVINTLRAWDIRIDEALFLGGMDKGAFLSAFGADIFFDDQTHHCQSATQQSVTAGHVPYGVVNHR